MFNLWRNQAWRIRQQQIEHCLHRVGKGMTTAKDEQLLRTHLSMKRKIK
jgi:hypothetical protein